MSHSAVCHQNARRISKCGYRQIVSRLLIMRMRAVFKREDLSKQQQRVKLRIIKWFSCNFTLNFASEERNSKRHQLEATYKLANQQKSPTSEGGLIVRVNSQAHHTIFILFSYNTHTQSYTREMALYFVHLCVSRVIIDFLRAPSIHIANS